MREDLVGERILRDEVGPRLGFGDFHQAIATALFARLDHVTAELGRWFGSRGHAAGRGERNHSGDTQFHRFLDKPTLAITFGEGDRQGELDGEFTLDGSMLSQGQSLPRSG